MTYRKIPNELKKKYRTDETAKKEKKQKLELEKMLQSCSSKAKEN